MTVKSAIKAGFLAASLVPAFVFTVGCNTDDTTPAASTPSAGKKDVNAPGAGGAPSTPKPSDAKKP